MIDIHCHILNNVDDGAESKEQSLEILTLAEEAGFTDIVLTPHYIKGYYDNNKEIISGKIKELKTEVYNSNILVNLYQGNEIYVSDDMTELLLAGVPATLAGSNYVLFEFPLNNKMFNDVNIITKIKQAGFIPVLAHPERYSYVQENINLVCDYIRAGAIIQSNYGSIVGTYGKDAKRTLEKLLENNMVHILASDTHRNGFVYENISRILKEIGKYITGEKIKQLTYENPKCIIQDEKIEITAPIEIEEKKRFFFI